MGSVDLTPCSAMKSIVVLSVVTLSIGLASGGLLFKKGAAIGAIKGLFKKKGEDDNRECQVRWEEVSKPVCTTSYERKCRNEPQQQCTTEHRQECWTEQQERCETSQERRCETKYERQCRTDYQEECWTEYKDECTNEEQCIETRPVSNSYSSSSSYKGKSKGKSIFKRSTHEDEGEHELDEETLKDVLDNMSASELIELTHSSSEDVSLHEDAESSAVEVFSADESASSRKKRAVGLIKGLIAGGLIGKKKSSKKYDDDSNRQCSIIQKCQQKPVQNCRQNPVEQCHEEPRENCWDEPQQRCWNEPQQRCKSVPEQKCHTVNNEVCWEEPREHCTEQKMKVAKRWCREDDDKSKSKGIYKGYF